jgi:aryl-alcohol dehydrogenase-like predicted oxidoreductase
MKRQSRGYVMQKVPLVSLGKTGLKVSKLGFGEVDFGDKDPFHLGPKEGWRILTESFKLGVNFWDVCDAYNTYRALEPNTINHSKRAR